VDNTLKRLQGMIQTNGMTSPEVRRAFMNQVKSRTADPAVVSSVVVGLELALDILNEEITNDRERRERG
jgi:hypothetical protein